MTLIDHRVRIPTARSSIEELAAVVDSIANTLSGGAFDFEVECAAAELAEIAEQLRAHAREERERA